MKKILLFLLTFCVVAAYQPKEAKAEPIFAFAVSVLVGGWAAYTYEGCKEDGQDLKECASKVWRERQFADLRQPSYGNQ